MLNVKEYLGQLERLELMTKQKKEELMRLRELAVSIGSPALSTDKVKSGSAPKAASFEKNIEKCMLLEEEIKQEISEFTAKRHTIINQIQSLDGAKYINVLYKRYVEYKKLDEIAEEMGYTYQHTRRLHAKALKNFERCYTMLHSDVI